MKWSRAAALILIAATAVAAGAENPPPREIWRDATNFTESGDVANATKRENDLLNAGRSYGVVSYPVYAQSAAALARSADKSGRPAVADWAAKAADALDPKSPAVAFSNADRFRDQNNWGRAIPAALTGFTRLFLNYRTRLLSRDDLALSAILALALTIALFALALLIRYGRSASHDFREIVSTRFRGGSVSVLGFALLFLPIFIWLGPIWLVLYWFVVFFGYANKLERVLIVLLGLVLAILPIAADHLATEIAGVDGPIVLSAISSREEMYQPEALPRMQELASAVPDNYVVQLLLGNLEQMEGDEQQALLHYRRSNELHDNAGAHVNIGNLHFLDGDNAAAATEYEAAEQLDPKLAIAFYNDSVANGGQSKFTEQGQKFERAKALDPRTIEAFAQTPPTLKIAMYDPPLKDAWQVQSAISQKGAAKSIFGMYPTFDLQTSAMNMITISSILAVIAAVLVWMKRRRAGFANACIKCGRTFCHRCKSARESATYCTQCIHIYLKRDGVSLDTKRTKLEEVHDYHTGMVRRNRLMATFVPGSAQVLEGHTIAGLLGTFFFFLFVVIAVFIGRLAPAIGPVAETAHLLVRAAAILLAVIMWLFLSLPVYRRKATV